MAQQSDLVRLSYLDTQFSTDPLSIQHTSYINRPGQRRAQLIEIWKREKELGRGAYSSVYFDRCMEGASKGKVRAVKRIYRNKGQDSDRELEAIALFSHAKYEDSFVKSYGWFQNESSIFITMELLPAGDLQQHLNSSRLRESEARLITNQILEALTIMHDHGFAHRDLKPSNILVVDRGPRWWVKVADFGISKRAAEGLTELRTLIGTPVYMAPEAIGLTGSGVTSDRNEPYSNAVDIWSTGVIAFVLLTNQLPFENLRQLNQYVTGCRPIPTNDFGIRKVSEQGRAFVSSLMALIPADRPIAQEALDHPWLTASQTAVDLDVASLRSSEMQYSMRGPDTEESDTAASARWTTQDSRPSNYELNNDSITDEKATSIPRNGPQRRFSSVRKPLNTILRNTNRLSINATRASKDRTIQDTSEVGEYGEKTIVKVDDQGKAKQRQARVGTLQNRHSDEFEDRRAAGKKGTWANLFTALVGQPKDPSIPLPKELSISLPKDAMHLTHVGFNWQTGEFTGLPKDWQQVLQPNGVTAEQKEWNPPRQR